MKEQKIQLSVNVNKVATLRNARGKNIPDLLEVTQYLIEAGAEGITIHPRPDERHIRRKDVYNLKDLLKKYSGKVEYNIEGYPSDKFFQLIADIIPSQCTLVPDPPDVLTSNAGWKLEKNKTFLKSVIKKLKSLPIRVSLFIDPLFLNETEFSVLKELAPDRIELYTERYAESWNISEKRKTVLAEYKTAAKKADQIGIGINAGHDLNQKNLPDLLKNIPEIKEVSIGQAFIADSLKDGMARTLQSYLNIMQESQR